jgi:hypothetical protein
VSAETESDRVALVRGALRLKKQRAPLPPGHLRVWQADRRSTDPISRLSREFDELAREAVDAAEVTAGLEAAGINDRIARQVYREESVFRLAELVLELVPREVPDPSTHDYNPWRRPFWNHVSRGMLYALPTLPYVVAIGFATVTSAGIWLLLVTCVIATAFTQGVAHLAHVTLGYGAPKATVRILRIALLIAALAGAALAGIGAVLTSANLFVCGISCGVLLYTAAATILMVFKREGLLLASLAPAIVLSILVLVTPGHLLGYPVLIGGALVVCIAVILGVAIWVMRDEARPRGPRWVPLERAEWAGAGLHALYGGIAAALMTFAVVDVLQFGNVVNGETLIGVGMLPLVLSLGFAEASVFGFRSECSTAMVHSYSRAEFQVAAKRVLTRRALAYTLTLTALTLLVLAPLMYLSNVSQVTAQRHLAYGELGVALLGAMMLVSCGLARRAAFLLGLGLICELVARRFASASLEQLTAAHVLVFAALIVVVWLAAFRDLVSPLRHR